MTLDTSLLSPEARELAEVLTYDNWGDSEDEFASHNAELISLLYAPDAISMPADHGALSGHDEIRAWYQRRAGEWPLRIQSEPTSIDVVGDLAIVAGIFRACRPAQKDVASLDHGGRYLAVYKRIDGEWRLWRDMDNASPDADVFYRGQPRGW